METYFDSAWNDFENDNCVIENINNEYIIVTYENECTATLYFK